LCPQFYSRISTLLLLNSEWWSTVLYSKLSMQYLGVSESNIHKVSLLIHFLCFGSWKPLSSTKACMGHKLNMHVNPSQGSPISWKVLDWWFLLVHLHLLLISQEILYKRLYILFSVGFFLNGLLGLKKKHQTFSDKIHGVIFHVTSNWHSLCCCTFPSEQMIASSFCVLN
jgi:hypothetical protein